MITSTPTFTDTKVTVKVGAEVIVKKCPDKHINKIPTSSSLYDIQKKKKKKKNRTFLNFFQDEEIL